jgi:3-oxoacyl-[acyl-carrier-protein] synthase-3
MRGTKGAGVRSLAVSFPRTERTKEYWRKKYPEMIATAEQQTLAKVWDSAATKGTPANAFDAEMAAFVGDPFRGTNRRRVLAPGETALSIELRAAEAALEAASMSAGDVDLMIVHSFLADQIGVGNAAFLSGALGLRGAAWNLETACTSTVVALQTACALVRAGEYKNVLCVVSCTYSRAADEDDSVSWFLGDGAAAFVVSEAPEGQGLLGVKVVNTAVTCGTFYYDLVNEPAERGPRVRMLATPKTGKVLRDTAEPFLIECCEGALAAAGVTLKDIDYFCVNTPTAWFASFVARALGVDRARIEDSHQLYANIGPVLTPVNLHQAAHAGRVKPGSLVLMYAIGSVSSAGAAVVRWGDVALGPMPEAPEVID